jgi:ABC-type cobalamin/Fe3+-siderophores transport system ATPase subunit
MQRTLVRLQGVNQSGKTTTLNLVWHKLKEYPGVIVIRDRSAHKDILGAILKIGDKLIGVISRSERRYLDVYFNQLIEAHCDVIICATRTYGNSVALVNGLVREGWQLKSVPKNRNQAEDQARATEIVERVLASV